MITDLFHPEDIKAAIRKRYRSLLAFERAHGLTDRSTTDVLRGRANRRVERAILRVMREDAKWNGQRSIGAADSSGIAPAHPLNEQAA